MAALSCRFNAIIYQKSRRINVKTTKYVKYSTEINPTEAKPAEDENEFRQLQLFKPKFVRKPRERIKVPMLPPRYNNMTIDQQWANVWPTAQSFKPSVVPLPLRQGFTEKGAAPPGKFGNLELMKIPNFLHLTPPAIKNHCAGIKKFCTQWPTELKNDEVCEKHFPIEVITNDYCHSGPSIRDSRARIVSIQVKLNSLNLDSHAKDKFLRLVGERYNRSTDIVTLVADRCPLKKQNYDYASYLLTAVYHESKKHEDWESQKTESDLEKYTWEGSKSHEHLLQLIEKSPQNCQSKWLQETPKNLTKDEPQKLTQITDIKNYVDAVTQMFNEIETDAIVTNYKNSTQALLGLPKNL